MGNNQLWGRWRARGSTGFADRLLPVALGVFVVGVAAIAAIFALPVLTEHTPGIWLYLLALLAPVGFVFALGFALWSGRRAR